MTTVIDKTLVDIIHSHALIIIGTCDRALVPTINRGFGARINAERTALDVLVASWPTPQTRTNIEQTRRIAVTFTAPETFQSYQLKGKVTSCVDIGGDDHQLSAAYCDTIFKRLTAIGVPSQHTSLVAIAKELFRVSFEVDAAFVQTPGKNAGQRL